MSPIMLRHVLFASIAAVGLIAPLASPATAEAGPAVVVGVGPGGAHVDIGRSYYPGPIYDRHHHHRHHFHVLYRTCGYEPWRDYGVYRCDDDAYAAARYLRV